MNRILFEPCEIEGGLARFGGERARHVAEVLHGTPGMPLKTGVTGGLVGVSTLQSLVRTPDGGWEAEVATCHDTEPPPPWFDMILAPPRPRVLKRLLPQLAALGAGKIVLAGAEKVEKDFWGATVLKEENMRPLLVEGLMQSGATALPEVLLRRAFKRFLRDELDAMFPAVQRVVAHPGGGATAAALLRTLHDGATPPARPLFAIGPEGGWTDAELALLAEHGFVRFSLGSRILKTETAAVAIPAAFMAAQGG